MTAAKINKRNIAQYIDHTLLKPDATEADIERLCGEAITYRFYSICISPSYVRLARELLKESNVRVSTVIGFPLGITLSEVKLYEALQAVNYGAHELDIVMNISWAKSGYWKLLGKEISDIVTATPHAVHKIIIETGYFSDEEKEKVAFVVLDSGAEYIKTSSGFGPSGADVRDVKLIKYITGGKMQIKASGGIKTLQECIALINAGATRIGTSSGVSIVRG